MITTDNREAADRMRLMRLHGIERDAWKRYRADGSWFYEVLEAGFKYNLTDFQSAMGLVQLAKCDVMKQARKGIAQRYSAAFSSREELVIPAVRQDRSTSWHLYILRLHLDRLNKDRNGFIEALRRCGVACSVHFIPFHLQPYYRRVYGHQPGDFPSADREYPSCLGLPIYPGMTETEINYVISAVLNTAAESRIVRAVATHVNPRA